MNNCNVLYAFGAAFASFGSAVEVSGVTRLSGSLARFIGSDVEVFGVKI